RDLYARLAGLQVSLPPLRDRIEDLGILIAALLPKVAAEPAKVSFTPDAVRALFQHGWPMNVRELEKTLEVACVLSRSGRVERAQLPAPVRGDTPTEPPTAGAADSGGSPAPRTRPLTSEDLARR